MFHVGFKGPSTNLNSFALQALGEAERLDSQGPSELRGYWMIANDAMRPLLDFVEKLLREPDQVRKHMSSGRHLLILKCIFRDQGEVACQAVLLSFCFGWSCRCCSHPGVDTIYMTFGSTLTEFLDTPSSIYFSLVVSRRGFQGQLTAYYRSGFLTTGL